MGNSITLAWTASRSCMQVGRYVEGQRGNLEDIVSQLSHDAAQERALVQNAIKNVIFPETTRKSYCHDKRARTAALLRYMSWAC
jgi:hypothetical protein